MAKPRNKGRMRRAYLKNYTMKSGIVPNREVLATYNNAAKSLGFPEPFVMAKEQYNQLSDMDKLEIETTHRLNGTKVIVQNKSVREQILRTNTFADTPAKEMRLKQRPLFTLPEHVKDEVLVQWQGERMQGFQGFRRVNIEVPHYGKLEKWFSGDEHFFVQRLGQKTFRSIVYRGRARAMSALYKNKIRWAEVFPSPQPSG